MLSSPFPESVSGFLPPPGHGIIFFGCPSRKAGNHPWLSSCLSLTYTLSCSMWDLVCFQGSNLGPWNWKHGVWAPRPPGKSPSRLLQRQYLHVDSKLLKYLSFSATSLALFQSILCVAAQRANINLIMWLPQFSFQWFSIISTRFLTMACDWSPFKKWHPFAFLAFSINWFSSQS